MTSCASCSFLQRLRCFFVGCDEFDRECARIDEEIDRMEEIRKVREEIEAAVRRRGMTSNT